MQLPSQKLNDSFDGHTPDFGILLHSPEVQQVNALLSFALSVSSGPIRLPLGSTWASQHELYPSEPSGLDRLRRCVGTQERSIANKVVEHKSVIPRNSKATP